MEMNNTIHPAVSNDFHEQENKKKSVCLFLRVLNGPSHRLTLLTPRLLTLSRIDARSTRHITTLEATMFQVNVFS